MNNKLFVCKPESFLFIPQPIRSFLGRAYLTLFGWTFLSVPASVAAAFYLIFYNNLPVQIFLTSALASMILPLREWASFRKYGQLLYEPLQFSTNIDESMKANFFKNDREGKQTIFAMHPHGIIPSHALLWACACDQYLVDPTTNVPLYGFGAAADAALYVPFLRNILGWLSAGSASYHVLKKGLMEGKVKSIPNRKPRHLFILPGGVAEVFTAEVGKHVVIVNSRRGLCRLSLETGAEIMPTYVFGANDFYHNLITHENWISRFCRKMRVGITWFWGWYFLPVPFFPRLTMCVGKAIPVKKWDGVGRIPEEKVDELLDSYRKNLTEVFEEYKSDAGYPEAQLEIQ